MQEKPEAWRGIVSFVRRSSTLPAKLQKAWDEYSDQYVLDIPHAHELRELSVAPDFHFDEAYIEHNWGNNSPLVVEIGTGQGENIAAAALREPERNFLAVEVYMQGVAHTLRRIGNEHIDNLRIAQVNAPELFASAFTTGIVDEVWTYFPDPWPKMKHHKRRIVQPALAADIHRSLKKNGLWRIATDIDDYALHVHEVMDELPGWKNLGDQQVSLAIEHVGKGSADEAEQLPHALFTESQRFDGRVVTSFEKKGLDKGHTIHDFTYQAVEEN